MSSTKAELVKEVLEKLVVLAAGQNPELEDTIRIESMLPDFMRTLAARELIYIPDLEAIPDGCLTPLAAVVAWECRSKFGIAAEELPDLKASNDAGIVTLKIMQRARPTYAPAQNGFL